MLDISSSKYISSINLDGDSNSRRISSHRINRLILTTHFNVPNSHPAKVKASVAVEVEVISLAQEIILLPLLAMGVVGLHFNHLGNQVLVTRNRICRPTI